MSSTAPTGTPASTGDQRPTHTPTALIAFAWTFVGVPLAYGLYQTVTQAADLFTG